MKQPMYCNWHGREKVFSHNTNIGGVRLGVYVCPVERCESLPDFGDPKTYGSADDDDNQQAEAVLAA